MSRRDIIIITVLLNTSLLAVLFFMARHGEDDRVSEQIEIARQVAAIPPEKAVQLPPIANPIPLPAHPQDEIDDVLKEYSVPSPSVSTLDESLDDAEKEDYADLYAMEPSPMEKDVNADRYLEVTIKRGDALEKIARANGTTVEAIKKLNRLNSEKVFVGQILRIPIVEKKSNADGKIGALPKKTDTSASSSGEAEYYVIKSGDNPWKIAKLYHVKFDELLKLNNLDEEKARNLKVGDKIRVK